MQLKNDLILRAAKGEITERTPVWLMRQAGRILPEYRKIRAKLSGFKELVETPELAAEVTLQPVDLLDVDAAIIFSDILVVPEAMGLTYQMLEKKGPYFPKTLKTIQDLDQLHIIEGDELTYVYDAIKIVKAELNSRVPLIGFAGAPWTIFSYMVEGGGSKTFSEARKFLIQQPQLAHQVLEMITKSTLNYLKRQVAAGADLVQIFDSWAGILSPSQYREFSLPYIEQIVRSLETVPVTVFAKGAYFAMKDMNNLSCQTIGLDWNMDIQKAKRLLADKTLQGNLDPAILYGDKNQIEKATDQMMKQFIGHPHIANLGHGVYPDTHPDQVKIFIEAVKKFNS
jgi:uroporphyrinogen decarboxylase|tara:strand:+ start:105291 stop:106313 length:1023 start_codon:yes stop_codon:yes gene_type:complete